MFPNARRRTEGNLYACRVLGYLIQFICSYMSGFTVYNFKQNLSRRFFPQGSKMTKLSRYNGIEYSPRLYGDQSLI